MIFEVLAGTALLAVVHLFAHRLRFLDVIPRSRWLSFASGISVAYVFLHLLPELNHARHAVSAALGSVAYLERHVYVLAALGLAVFYGLERLAERSRAAHRQEQGEDCTTPEVFWLHIGSFALYNLIIGYVLVERARDPRAYLLFLLAMALHFLVNDYGLRLHHKDAYRQHGRWVLAAAVALGTGVGLMTSLPEPVLYIPLAFVGGAVVLNVLKEELPNERESRFSAFALGMLVYGAIIFAA